MVAEPARPSQTWGGAVLTEQSEGARTWCCASDTPFRTMTERQLEPSSFRDRQARIFYYGGAVYRGLNEQALKEWERLSSAQFFSRLVRERKLIPTERADHVASALLPGREQWAAILKHQKIPFVSYPYEWSFGMLKDAALLQLELLLATLDEGMILKDSSPFNVQWQGAEPVFIDLTSFHELRPGDPWVGYRQFCQLFLYPLLLLAYKNIPFQPWLRGSLEGIQPDHCLQLMSARDYARPGVVTHVYLQARAQARYGGTKRDIRAELRGAGFDARLIKANAQGLYKLVQRLTWQCERSTWSDYASQSPYQAADAERKAAFVREIVSARRWTLVWDMGCNTGAFSRIAAEHADYVVALDADQVAIERFYQALKAEQHTKILPLLANVADPSPNLGWRGLERKALEERTKPDLVLCLALAHHLVISANIPLDELVDWLADLGADVIIEFITKSDPMVQALLHNKDDQYADYDKEYFERRLSSRFTIARQETLASGNRILYHATTALTR